MTWRVTHTHMGMSMRVNSYATVYMGDPTGLFFWRRYEYGVVIHGGYLPIAISTWGSRLAIFLWTRGPHGCTGEHVDISGLLLMAATVPTVLHPRMPIYDGQCHLYHRGELNNITRPSGSLKGHFIVFPIRRKIDWHFWLLDMWSSPNPEIDVTFAMQGWSGWLWRQARQKVMLHAVQVSATLVIPIRACSDSSQSMWIEWDCMGLKLKQVKPLLIFSNPI